MSAVAVGINGLGPDAGGGGPLGGGLELLGRFVAEIDDPAVPYRVVMTIGALEGRLACESFTIERKPPGPAVIGTALRSAVLDSYMARIREQLGEHGGAFIVVKERARDETAQTFTGVTESEWDTFDQAQRRDKPIEVAEVADLYREAVGSADSRINRAPTAAVARRLGVHRGHAARLVSRARKEGLLGPARAGRSGEVTES